MLLCTPYDSKFVEKLNMLKMFKPLVMVMSFLQSKDQRKYIKGSITVLLIRVTLAFPKMPVILKRDQLLIGQVVWCT